MYNESETSISINEKEKIFFEIATPELIRKWIHKFGLPPVNNSQQESRNSESKKIRFISKTDQCRSLGAIKLSRGLTQFDSLKPDTSTEERRSSLQIMRQFKSMPDETTNNLSSLIGSKVTLPQVQQDIRQLRLLRESCWLSFYTEILSEILTDLNWKTLVNKIKTSAALLTYSDYCALFVRNILECNIDSVSIQEFLRKTGKASFKEKKEIIISQEELPMEAALLNISSVKCLPLVAVNNVDQSVGAILLVNAMENENVTKHMHQFIQCCSKALNNASLFETYSKEFERNKALLETVHDLYKEQSSLENFMKRSLYQMKSLIKFDEIAVFLFSSENDTKNQFKQFFSLDKNDKFSISEGRLGSKKIALMVAISGETFRWKKDEKLEELHELQISVMVCKPIVDSSDTIIGSVQVMNKTESNMTQNAENILEAMIIFCTVGIINCRLYEDMRKSNARAQVALEALSYQTSASPEDILHLMNQEMPEFDDYNLGRHQFNDFALTSDKMILAVIRVLSGVNELASIRINRQTLYRWVLTVMKNYRNVAYHNWTHAFNVFHTMYYMLCTKDVKRYLTNLEILGMLVGCICHDLDHRGTNNTFQIKTDSALARLYGNQATLEHHHFNLTVLIINSEGNNIFQSLTTDQYSLVMDIVKQSILATDLNRHFDTRKTIFEEIRSNQIDWADDLKRGRIRDMLMTCCDLSSATKRWTVAHKAAYLVMEEFFKQGDVEKQVYNMTPQDMMDRSKEKELPQIQMQWIDNVCEPLYKHLSLFDDSFKEMYNELMDNRKQWQKLSQDGD